jgi:SAM-dependent methyltransferase
MCRKALERLLPRGTRRRVYYELGLSSLRVISNEGWKSFIVKTRNRLKRQTGFTSRELIANTYISGSGIEIGALNLPLQLPRGTTVKYVDKYPEDVLRKRYSELESVPLVHVDIIDDGEVLSMFGDATQDFVIANHFLEHCRDPIGAIGNMLRTLKDSGVLYAAVPDKRFTFDAPRPVTSLLHLIKDHQDQGEKTNREAYEEWVRLIEKIDDPAGVAAETARLMAIEYSIHYHVWTQCEILELVAKLKQDIRYGFELELFAKVGSEMVFVLRKGPKT